jgi:hypothetical protein
VEVRSPVLQQADGLAVEDDALGREARHHGIDCWEVLGPIAPGARPQVHDAIIAPRDDPVAVPYELVNPFIAYRDLASEDRLTRPDETRRTAPVAGTDGTPNHTTIMGDGLARASARPTASLRRPRARLLRHENARSWKATTLFHLVSVAVPAH